MKSSIVKRSIVIGGHKTSVSLEEQFWSGLKEIAHAQAVTPSKLVATIDGARQHGNLSSAIRLFVLNQVRNSITRGRVRISNGNLAAPSPRERDMISEYELRMMAHDTYVQARTSDDALKKRRLLRLADDYLRQADELFRQRIIRAAYRKSERKVWYSLRP